MKSYLHVQSFHSRKCIWKCRLCLPWDTLSCFTILFKGCTVDAVAICFLWGDMAAIDIFHDCLYSNMYACTPCNNAIHIYTWPTDCTLYPMIWWCRDMERFPHYRPFFFFFFFFFFWGGGGGGGGTTGHCGYSLRRASRAAFFGGFFCCYISKLLVWRHCNENNTHFCRNVLHYQLLIIRDVFSFFWIASLALGQSYVWSTSW